MSSSNVVNLGIGLVVLIWILSRQLQTRPAKTDMRLPVVLAVIGVIQLSRFLHSGGKHPGEVAAALAGSSLLAALFGMARAATVHVWVDQGQTWRRGNWLTAALWVVSIGVHLGYDYLVDGRGPNAGLGSAALLLYFAVTYAVQRVIVQQRSKSIAAREHLAPDTHMTVR